MSKTIMEPQMASSLRAAKFMATIATTAWAATAGIVSLPFLAHFAWHAPGDVTGVIAFIASIFGLAAGAGAGAATAVAAGEYNDYATLRDQIAWTTRQRDIARMEKLLREEGLA